MSELYSIKKETLDAIGSAVREKTGSSDLIPVSDIASSILSITGGPSTCFLYGAFRCKGVTYSQNVTEAISHTVVSSVSAKILDNSGNNAASMDAVARISLRALAGDGSGNYSIVYDASSSPLTYDYSSAQSCTFLIVFNTREAVSLEFFTAFVAMFEPMEILQAGTYRMTSYYCEEYNSGAFAWESQNLSGKLTCDYNSKTNLAFTSISNDGQYYVHLYNDGSQVGDFSPSWYSEYTTKITLDEAQIVTEGFKAWWDMCFVVEDTLLTAISAGTYTLNNTWYNSSTQYVIEGWTEQAISGTVKDGGSGYTYTFDSMSYYEYSTEASDAYGNELYFINDGSNALSLNYNYATESYQHTITLAEAQIVTKGFKAWWDMCFGSDEKVILQAGTYHLNSIYDSYDGYVISSEWSEQALVGTITSNTTNPTVENASFNKLVASSETLNFNYDSTNITHLCPGEAVSDGCATIILSTAQMVSSGFQTWWNTHTTVVEDSGGDSGGDSSGEVTQAYMRSGSYEITSTYPSSYYEIPYGAYETTAKVSGTVYYAGGTMGNFDSIKLSGYGGGADAPYVGVAFYSGASSFVSWSYTDSWDSFGFNIDNDALVPLLFYLIAKEMFTKQ